MRKIFCIFLYLFTSISSSFAVDFELSDLIKQARDAEIAKYKQTALNETLTNKKEKQVQNNKENNNNSEQITNSSLKNSPDIQKEQ